MKYIIDSILVLIATVFGTFIAIIPAFIIFTILGFIMFKLSEHEWIKGLLIVIFLVLLLIWLL